MAPKLRTLLTLGLIVLNTMASVAQQSSPPLKSGLVLSGGGARGLAHIGVLKVLEEVGMPIDAIGGTSMGAIVGGLYASGYNAAQLEAIVLEIDWVGLFSDQVSRRHTPIDEKSENSRYLLNFPIRGTQVSLPSGLVTGQEVFKFLSGLTWHVQHIRDFNELPIPFVCVATDLSTGEAVVIRSGSLAEAMRASMTLPSIFAPPLVHGKRVLDGGIVRNFPVVDVIDMGADILIGVDVATILPSADSVNTILDILNQTVSFSIEQSSVAQRQLVTILLQPDMPNAGILTFDQARAIIDAGEAAARERIQELAALAKRLQAGRPAPPPVPHVPVEGQPILLRSVRFEGLNRTSPILIDAELGTQLPLNAVATRREVNLAVDRLFSLGHFDAVTYRLEPLVDGYRIIFEFQEKQHDQFRAGMRYDSRDKASLIFNGTFRNRFLNSSTFRLTSRLGQYSYLDGQLTYTIGTHPRLGMSVRSGFSRQQMDQYRGKVNTGTAQTDRWGTEIWVGPLISSYLQSGLGYHYDIYETRAVAGAIRQPQTRLRDSHGPFAFVTLDTANDAYFPTNGQYLVIRTDWGNPMNGARRYERYEAVWRNHIPFSEHITAHLNFMGGFATGQLPTYRAFYLGDLNQVVGFRRDEINGTSYRMAQLALQMEIVRKQFLTLRVNAVGADGFWEAPASRIQTRFGWGISYGLNTVIGPLELTVMGNADRFMPLAWVSVGFQF